MLEDLRKGLAGLRRAAVQIHSMLLGYREAEIDAALTAGEGRVSFRPSMPTDSELVTFAFDFKHPSMNEAPLVKTLQYEWQFGDRTGPAAGKKCVHFFKTAKSLKLPWSSPSPSDFKGHVSVVAPFGTPFSFPFGVSVRRRRLSLTLPIIDTAAFLATLVIALIVVFASHVGDARPFMTFNDYVTPFIWGFGLDQIKEQATRLKGA